MLLSLKCFVHLTTESWTLFCRPYINEYAPVAYYNVYSFLKINDFSLGMDITVYCLQVILLMVYIETSVFIFWYPVLDEVVILLFSFKQIRSLFFRYWGIETLVNPILI